MNVKKGAVALAVMVATTGGVAVSTGSAAQAATPNCSRQITNIVYYPAASDGAWRCGLKYGNNNAAVSTLQLTLNYCYKENLDVDGDFGSRTQAALKRAQATVGVSADGEYGPITAGHLKFVYVNGGCMTLAQAGIS
ncbi:peptidoglycan-binding domain-containing protein [Dactylosporangium sp. NPDC000555]|uniref:peptidoglycan-binding domain-containing protein n=1 Tax=Dactylosporangium sp. NPDC000555 TaxID=3154260 RepID=UPI00332D8603